MARYFLTGTVAGRPVRFELRNGTQSVGRVAQSDIILQDTAVSRTHAEIEVRENVVHVRDQSLNGTYLNEEKVDGEAVMKPGDVLRFGHLNLTLMEHEVTPFTSISPQGTVPHTMTTSFKEIQQKSQQNRSDRLLTALAETGQLLSRRLEMNELYTEMLNLLERFMTCSRILILGYDDDGNNGDDKKEPVVIESRIIDTDLEQPLRMSKHMLDEILIKGKSLLTSDASQNSQWNSTESIVQVGIHAAIGAPLFDNDKVLGAIYIDSRRPGVTYNEEDLRLLTLLGNMIAVKITNSRLEEDEIEFENLKRELSLAARIQRKLLPPKLPEVEGYSMFAHLAPCEDIGGDLYDVHMLPDGNVWLTLGDVTGHGIGAAMLMSHVMAGLQLLEMQSHDPVNMVESLESHLNGRMELGQFVTLFAGLLNPKTGRLVFVNAGHPPPILLSAEETRLLETTGTAVGLLPGPQVRTSGECIIKPGDTLLIFSDGIPETEADGPPGADSEDVALYDEGRMQEFMAAMDRSHVDDIARALLEDVDAFRGDSPVTDDLTLMVINRV